MEEDTLPSWMTQIEIQPFVTSQEPSQLIDVVSGLVSRDKLLAWEMFAVEQKNKSSNDILPSVRIHGLAISIVIFVVSLHVTVITPAEPAASRCLSLLLLAVSLWISEVPFALCPLSVTFFHLPCVYSVITEILLLCRQFRTIQLPY